MDIHQTLLKDTIYNLSELICETRCSYTYADFKNNCVVKIIKDNTNPQVTEREVLANKIVKNCNYILKNVENIKQNIMIFSPICRSDLFEIIVCSKNRTSEIIVASYIFQILKALDFCHINDIVHCDVKPENMLMQKDNKSIMLCDFGHCMLNKTYFKNIGTFDYLSPQICKDIMASKFPILVNSDSDMWALGISCFELLTQLSPYDDLIDEYNRDNFLTLIPKMIDYKFTYPDFLSIEAKHFLKLLLCETPMWLKMHYYILLFSKFKASFNVVLFVERDLFICPCCFLSNGSLLCRCKIIFNIKFFTNFFWGFTFYFTCYSRTS